MDATPLHVAAAIPNRSDMITLLADAGADVNAQTSFGFTPLDLATRVANNEANIQALLAAGATCGPGHTFVDGTCRYRGSSGGQSQPNGARAMIDQLKSRRNGANTVPPGVSMSTEEPIQ